MTIELTLENFQQAGFFLPCWPCLAFTPMKPLLTHTLEVFVSASLSLSRSCSHSLSVSLSFSLALSISLSLSLSCSLPPGPSPPFSLSLLSFSLSLALFRRLEVSSDESRNRQEHYRVIPAHRNWQIETAVWNLAGFLHCALETR